MLEAENTKNNRDDEVAAGLARQTREEKGQRQTE